MKILNGNNLELLKSLPDNSIDAVVTDPPYGLGKEPIAEQLMKDWIEKGYHEVKGGGFMGKEWDAFVPQPIFWKEVYRVLKHGGHVVSFFGTRTYDWGVMAMRFAGFEVRDCLQWLYGSGFPKSYNVGKGIESKIVLGNCNPSEFKNLKGEVSKQSLGLANADLISGHKTKAYDKTKIEVEYQSEQGKQWVGWGSALKPANEPIVLARKPLEKGLSIAENVLKWGVGGINIDGCRVDFKNKADYKESTQKNQHEDFGTLPMTNNNVYGDYSMVKPKNYEPSGRFPANVILTHHPECECLGTKKVKSVSSYKSKEGYESESVVFNGQLNSMKSDGYGDENGQETIEDWNCHEDCPIKILDEQSGVSKSIGGRIGNKNGDKGGASRFFYVAKASQKERNKGLEDYKQNNHPTVKPIKLMQYLVRLITPPNGVVLDPFMGSGTTGIACKLEGFDFIGMEQDENYAKIAKGRIENYVDENVDEKQEIEKEEIKLKLIQTELF